MSVSYGTPAGVGFWDIRGKSTDEKPVKGVPDGSTFYEKDTKKAYMFDADTNTWIEQ